MTRRARIASVGAVAAAIAASAGVARSGLASSSADELVRQAQAHEAAREDDLAVRRYMEALAIEATNEGAWMGLGALRARQGDLREAERVYSAALERLPSLHAAMAARARTRWALGRHEDAEADLEDFASTESNPAAWRELAGWYGADGRTPAQLAAWRRLLWAAIGRADAPGEREARGMVRALVLLVDGADPACSPPGADATRRALAAIARRAGSATP